MLDDLAALDPSQRREVAKELRKVVETFAEVPDGRHTAHTLRALAYMLDSGLPTTDVGRRVLPPRDPIPDLIHAPPPLIETSTLQAANTPTISKLRL